MKRKLVLPILAFLMLILFVAVNIAYADSDIKLAVCDTAGNPKSKFDLGEPVRIKFNSTSTPINLTIYDPSNTKIHSQKYYSTVNDITFNDITTQLGWYTVTASSPIPGAPPTIYNFAVTYYQVVPEVPLGTAVATTTLGLALVTFGIFKRRK